MSNRKIFYLNSKKKKQKQKHRLNLFFPQMKKTFQSGSDLTTLSKLRGNRARRWGHLCPPVQVLLHLPLLCAAFTCVAAELAPGSVWRLCSLAREPLLSQAETLVFSRLTSLIVVFLPLHENHHLPPFLGILSLMIDSTVACFKWMVT